MKSNSTTLRIFRAASGLVMLALLAGCSGGGSTDPVGQVAELTRSLGSNLSHAIDVANDASIGFTDEASRAGAIAGAAAAAQGLAETVGSVGDPNLRLLAQDVVSVANRVVEALQRGDVPTAARLRVDEFVPLASQLTAMRPQSSNAASSNRSQSPDLIVPGTLAVLVVLAVAGFLTRRARRGLDAEHPAERNTRTNAARAWNQPHPLYSHDAGDRTRSASAETRRTRQMRTLHFDLKTLLQTTIEQLRENGWEITAVCPSVQLSGDPVRLQRALTAAVGTAKLRGAEQVGLAVEVVEGGVLLTVGDDATIESEEATELAERLAGQVAAALGRDDIGVSWMSDDEVTLFTVSLPTDDRVPPTPIEQAPESTDIPQDPDAGKGARSDEGEGEQPWIRAGHGNNQR